MMFQKEVHTSIAFSRDNTPTKSYFTYMYAQYVAFVENN